MEADDSNGEVALSSKDPWEESDDEESSHETAGLLRRAIRFSAEKRNFGNWLSKSSRCKGVVVRVVLSSTITMVVDITLLRGPAMFLLCFALLYDDYELFFRSDNPGKGGKSERKMHKTGQMFMDPRSFQTEMIFQILRGIWKRPKVSHYHRAFARSTKITGPDNSYDLGCRALFCVPRPIFASLVVRDGSQLCVNIRKK